MSVRMKLSKITILTALVFGLLMSVGAVLAYNGPYQYDAIVPSFGTPNWYSEPQTASGSAQKSYVSSIGGGYDGDINGWISNDNGSAISSSYDLYSGKTYYYNTSATSGSKVEWSMDTHFWVPVNVEVKGSWWS
ncbi:hypothetical protein [Effusibacillus pohliae]|uniref:hypothetical protein n=1 Tax=Effusibacillus pohliae TaxID=232270 RepID=UPI000375BD90|nr:hypothetical protein [Effusibacillus pohliae]